MHEFAGDVQYKGACDTTGEAWEKQKKKGGRKMCLPFILEQRGAYQTGVHKRENNAQIFSLTGGSEDLFFVKG